MDPNPVKREELYRAAVGDSKAGYYLPLFQRFDQPGGSRVSWNWPALFVTFLWMIYRRMYGPALVYFFGYPLALLPLMTLVGALLGWSIARSLYWVCVIGVQFAVAPMFANFLYHWHVRKRIDQLAATSPSHEALVQRLIGQSGSNTPVIVAVVCLGGFVMLGFLAAIAIPAYQDYTIRAQVSEGLVLASPIKASVAQAYAASGSWPAELEGAIDSARYVSSIEVSDGTILIRYGKAANSKISGQTLSLHPAVVDGEQIEWACGYAAGETAETDIAPRYLPRSCREPPTQRL
jgi:type IV pilus assembly protein PilA